MTKHVRRFAFALAMVPLLVSCDSGPGLTPHFKFSYSGLATGTFDVSGAKIDGNNRGVLAFTDSGVAIAIGVNYDEGAPISLAAVGFPSPSAGTLPFADTCELGDACAALFFYMTSGTAFLTCVSTSGSVTIATSTATQSSGTFSGTVSCTDSDDVVVGTLTITDGSFEAKYGANPLGG